MSYTKETTIWCDSDDCEEWETYSTNRVVRARSDARDRGWSCPSDGDFCPECSD